jgi:phosphopantetheinyl transferase (holo-ACP synthase)
VSAIYVGNDIVDLGEPRTEDRSSDDRFVNRVFDTDEQAVIRASSDADLELWSRWAAKETGFKVVSKLIGTPPPFVHRAFKVAWTELLDAPESDEVGVVREGRVTYGDHEARVSVWLRPGGVHATGFGTAGRVPEHMKLRPHVALLDTPGSPWAGPLEELEARFTERERDAVYSLQSAAVRLGARADLASALSVDEERLEIVCDPGPTSQRPPRVLLDGHRAKADVSLSHDGRWVAWVICTDKDSGGR